MEKYLALVLALIFGLTVSGCSSESGDVDGGFGKHIQGSLKNGSQKMEANISEWILATMKS